MKCYIGPQTWMEFFGTPTFSNRAASHCKNKNVNLCHHDLDFGLKVTWNFTMSY